MKVHEDGSMTFCREEIALLLHDVEGNLSFASQADHWVGFNACTSWRLLTNWLHRADQVVAAHRLGIAPETYGL